MCENETETNPCTCAIDPSVLELIRHLAQALQMHHVGFTTTESFAHTYERDLKLVNRAEDFLSIAEGETQTWRIPEVFR